MPGTTLSRGNVLASFLVGPSITPSAVNANTSAAQTFTVKGLLTTDRVSVSLSAAQTAGIGVANAYVSATDTLSIAFSNCTTASATPAAGTYTVSVMRPESTPLPASAV